MSNIFAASEVVEIGIQIEKNGRDFYNTLKEGSKNQKAAEVFSYLAGEEERHIAAFVNILDKLEKHESAESYPGEYFAYMNSLAREYIFTQKNKGKEVAQKAKSDKEAVDLGIGFEKESIVFYQGMKKVVPHSGVKIVEELIAQEEQHIEKLNELKKTLI